MTYRVILAYASGVREEIRVPEIVHAIYTESGDLFTVSAEFREMRAWAHGDPDFGVVYEQASILDLTPLPPPPDPGPSVSRFDVINNI